ncbi:S1 RNA-binding domain-containing protein [Angelakisella massiliensis]|uniref:S1 RNA-binding domain-containing protein n=1 Tax=Angelakisella massiliensis TaxID=1871018 RepID=UPI0023A809CD|nr:S1 RNA-binding domain-containing protein [Angelakisella massiliensis]
MTSFLPEGSLLGTEENDRFFRGPAALEEARASQRILEARAVVCDPDHNLIVDLGFIRGLIPRCEGAAGISDGSTRDIAIISRVGKPVCFVVTGLSRSCSGRMLPLLSRRQAQQRCREEYLSRLVPGDVIPGRVTHLENFGAFVDMGCGLPSLIPIDHISVSRIAHPRDRFRPGDSILAVVKSLEPDGRICLSHKELLGTWEENAALFQPGETVAGVVRSVENYGVFVELTPNLAGLAEPFGEVRPGQHASVYIKSILPDKMKIKLILVDAFDAAYTRPELRYFVTGGHMDRWVYSTSSSPRKMETIFSPAAAESGKNEEASL